VKYAVTVAGRSFEIEVDHEHLVRVNGHPLYVDLEQVGGLPVYSLAVDDEGYLVFIEEGHGESPSTMPYLVEVQGQIYPVEVESQRPQLAPRKVECSGEGAECLRVCAPLAGTLLSLPVAVGERVGAGQVLAVVESMKMKMELRAPQAAVVDSISGPTQRDVGQGEELLILRAL
jgi:biotin carboxyl carrier protein